MKYVVTSEQVESLKNNIQTFIDYSLNSIREQSEEWGLGEMDELDEIESIDKIVKFESSFSFQRKHGSSLITITITYKSTNKSYPR